MANEQFFLTGAEFNDRMSLMAKLFPDRPINRNSKTIQQETRHPAAHSRGRDHRFYLKRLKGRLTRLQGRRLGREAMASIITTGKLSEAVTKHPGYIHGVGRFLEPLRKLVGRHVGMVDKLVGLPVAAASYATAVAFQTIGDTLKFTILASKHGIKAAAWTAPTIIVGRNRISEWGRLVVQADTKAPETVRYPEYAGKSDWELARTIGDTKTRAAILDAVSRRPKSLRALLEFYQPPQR